MRPCPLLPTPTLFTCLGYHLVVVVLTQAVRDMQNPQLANEMTFEKAKGGASEIGCSIMPQELLFPQ